MSNGMSAERVDSLENYMKDLGYQALKTERELARLSAEMREFKNEMNDFKEEMREFEEMSDFKDEMRDFKNEMSDFKDEMLEFKNQSERDRREMNRKWVELANKMGTLVEDLVAPNIPRVARELFGCEELEYFGIRTRRRLGPDTLELDALAVCKTVVLINETKSTLTARDVDEILSRVELFPSFFPEFADRRPVGVLAGLYADERLVRYATSKAVLVMAMGDETMQILNPEAAG